MHLPVNWICDHDANILLLVDRANIDAEFASSSMSNNYESFFHEILSVMDNNSVSPLDRTGAPVLLRGSNYHASQAALSG